MAGRLFKHWRVLAAAFASVVLIIGAYVFAKGFESPQVVQASTETALLQQLAAKDSDQDGLPDWEEALYGADPHNPDTFHLGMTDGEAVAKGLIVPKAVSEGAATTTVVSDALVSEQGLPAVPTSGTLTSAFTQYFLSQYLAAKEANGGAALTSDQTSTLADTVVTDFMQNIALHPDFKKEGDLTVSPKNGTEALRMYAASAEAVMRAHLPHPQPTGDQVQYLQLYLDSGNKDALTELATIAQYYRETAAGLSALPVPAALVPGTLAVINAMMRVSEATAAFAQANSDALSAMLSLPQYAQASRELGTAFTDVTAIYAAAGLTIPEGTPGALFANFGSVLTTHATP